MSSLIKLILLIILICVINFYTLPSVTQFLRIHPHDEVIVLRALRFFISILGFVWLVFTEIGRSLLRRSILELSIERPVTREELRNLVEGREVF